MSSVIHKTANPSTLQYTYLHSVNTPDYDPTYWLYNPDVQDLVNEQIPQKYWKVVSTDTTSGIVYTVVEMTDEEKAAVEAAMPVPQPQKVSLTEEYRDKTGKLRVHQTSRKEGLAIHWTSEGDDRSDPKIFGKGKDLSHVHNIGDETSHTVYVDFNSLENESWVHEVVLTWKGCFLDIVTVDIVPDVVSIVDSTSSTFTTYGPLIIPAAPGTGTIDLAQDVLAYGGGLVSRDSPSDPFVASSPAFWDADWNSATGRFENLRSNPTGDGQYNMFHTELILNRTFNRIQLLGYGFQVFNSSDTDELTHGLRLKCIFETRLPDHDWAISGIVVMHRKNVQIGEDSKFVIG